MLDQYFKLTKSGIQIFVLLLGVCGLICGLPTGKFIETETLVLFLLGLYCISGGSLAFNQWQEVRFDKLMNRTKKRPIITGSISAPQALIISVLLILLGALFLALISLEAFYAGCASVILYNVFYTLYWKKKWTFGAVPGALPGALPVTIGFLVANKNFMDPVHIYLFLIVFLWQMPHFWILAIRYKDDYKLADIPVLPLKLGVEKTFLHIGLYVFAYLMVAFTGPIVLSGGKAFLITNIVFSFWVLLTFIKVIRKGEKAWLPFFLALNFSVIAYCLAPTIEKILKMFPSYINF